jgi:hypothetical protein
VYFVKTLCETGRQRNLGTFNTLMAQRSTNAFRTCTAIGASCDHASLGPGGSRPRFEAAVNNT